MYQPELLTPINPSVSSSLNYPTLDAAIGQAEGYNTPGTIAQTQNNPGNLVYNGYTQSLGATGAGTNGIAIFPDANTGQSAEDALVSSYASQGLTIDQIAANWAPAAAPGNDASTPNTWASNVASYLGVPQSTPAQALAGQTQGTGPSSVTGVPTTSASSVTGVLGNIASAVAGPLGTLANASATGSLWGLPLSQIGAFLAALIVIAGAIFLFKPVQNFAVKAGKRGAALAAI